MPGPMNAASATSWRLSSSEVVAYDVEGSPRSMMHVLLSNRVCVAFSCVRVYLVAKCDVLGSHTSHNAAEASNDF